ncbi:MAG: nuclease-related domain-containing protein [Actinomycetes bacterium]
MAERTQTKSENLIASALREQFGDDAVVLTGLRFTDDRHGDVEADAIVFIPDQGVAIIEVKGGVVEYVNGDWLVRTKRGGRRCHPVKQARGAKHALRSFLERQPEWSGGRIRAEWFVAMPFTSVERDFGPEGRREQLIGSADLPSIRTQIEGVLANPEMPERRPTALEIHLASSLLHASADVRPGFGKSFLRRWGAWLGIMLLLLGGLGFWGIQHFTSRSTSVGVGVGCSPHYVPCVPLRADMDCTQIRHQERVVDKQDPYHLDADGDGLGCEVWPKP